MPYQLRKNAHADNAALSAARGQIRAALRDCRRTDTAKAVHQIRKSGKKMRALLRLIRYTQTQAQAQNQTQANPDTEARYRFENAHYRAINNSLAASRDAGSLYQALDKQLGSEKFPYTAAFLRGRIKVTSADELAQAEQLLKRGLAQLAHWQIAPLRWRDLKRGYRKSYRRTTKAIERAINKAIDKAIKNSPRDAVVAEDELQNFHTLRKRVKDQWYQSRLLEKRYPETIGTRVTDLKVLASALGDWRDLRLLCHFLVLNVEDEKAMEEETAEEKEREIKEGIKKERIPLLDCARQRLQTLRREIDHLCKKLFARKKWPKA